MTSSEPNEYLQYLLELQMKEATTKNEKEGELVQGEKKHFDYLTFKYHIFFISYLF
jgi:hypothetical protein